MQQHTQAEIRGLILLLTGSERMADNISQDYAQTLQQFGKEGVTIDADRWLVLTLISYGYDVDRLKPITAAASKPATLTERIRNLCGLSRETFCKALMRVPFPDRFCFLLRYAMGWELTRIARLMLCDVRRVEVAIGSGLMAVRQELPAAITEVPVNAQA